ncbi:LOW QUALITY PROTEIN: probable imidazolonepropionase, partial [Paramacrobiotus metropolitanus]|uniref:LOW QUALITY PROTEIN: probable imidazolonepropionase n=1 Tax=Paramacrobiotus metropolitanus TaxID=2943436 RepID=UPI002446200A
VKSGYVLDFASEVKLLRVLQRVKAEIPMTLSITYCGARAVPKGSTPDAVTEDIVNHDLPELRRMVNQGELSIDNVDIFCEKNVFSVELTRRILEKARSLDFHGNFHAEELSYLGGTEIGVAVGARAISHLEHISEAAMQRMTDANCVAVLLPTTAFLMRLVPPPVRAMIDAGVPVALGTDFNPNAYCTSLPLVMHLAAVTFHMSLSAVLVASTLNAAASLGLSHSHGSLETGKCADLMLIRAPRWEHLVYQLGNASLNQLGNASLIRAVIKNGSIVYGR